MQGSQLFLGWSQQEVDTEMVQVKIQIFLLTLKSAITTVDAPSWSLILDRQNQAMLEILLQPDDWILGWSLFSSRYIPVSYKIHECFSYFFTSVT
jgi:hypothetical protein